MNKYQHYLAQAARHISKFQSMKDEGETFKSIRRAIKHSTWWMPPFETFNIKAGDKK